jgi:hypothetical protein
MLREARSLPNLIVLITLAFTNYHIRNIPCEENKHDDRQGESGAVRNSMKATGFAGSTQASWD